MSLSYTVLLGFPVIYWMGFISLFFLVCAGLIGVLNRFGKFYVAAPYHPWLGASGIVFALIHVSMHFFGY